MKENERAAWTVILEEILIPLSAVVYFLHSKYCLDLSWKTLAFEAAAVAHSGKERKEVCHKRKKQFHC